MVACFGDLVYPLVRQVGNWLLGAGGLLHAEAVMLAPGLLCSSVDAHQLTDACVGERRGGLRGRGCGGP